MDKNKIYIVTSVFLILALIGAACTSDIDAPAANVEEALVAEIDPAPAPEPTPEPEPAPEPEPTPTPEPEIIEEQPSLEVSVEQVSDVALTSSASSDLEPVEEVVASDEESSVANTPDTTESNDENSSESEVDKSAAEGSGEANEEKQSVNSEGQEEENIEGDKKEGEDSSGGASSSSTEGELDSENAADGSLAAEGAVEVAEGGQPVDSEEENESSEETEKVKRPNDNDSSLEKPIASDEDNSTPNLADQEPDESIDSKDLIVEKELAQDGEKILVTDQKSGKVIIEAEEFNLASTLSKKQGTKTLFVKDGQLLLGVDSSDSATEDAWEALLHKKPTEIKSDQQNSAKTELNTNLYF